MGCVIVKEKQVLDDAETKKERDSKAPSRRGSNASIKQDGVRYGEEGNKGRDMCRVRGRGNGEQFPERRRREKRMIRVESNFRLGNLPKHVEGEQVAAGWPAWLSAVAGEAIRGWIPRRADTFQKLDKIGQGTYSNVYKARDIDSGKIVALKKVHFDNLEPESVKFMAREILVLRQLDHPNVVKLEGLVTSRMCCSLYLVFEYMEHDLAGLAACPGIVFTEPQVKCYVHQLLSGLEHCHSRGILHRDIKGSNLLLDNGGILKIADFGLATFFNPDQKQPMTSRVVTLWYRPPELLLGATEYDATVDLWSTGCILAELLAGKPIMPGRTEVEQLHKIFKLCGSPSEVYWKKSKLPHATIFKPQQPYKRCILETFKDFTPSSLSLIETLLAIEPADRGTAAAALNSEFFTTKPYACDPSSLPQYPPSKEMDAKKRDAEARRQRTAGGKARGVDGMKKTGNRDQEGRAVPAPEANAELQMNLQKRRLISQSNAKSKSEKFPPAHEDGAVGFPMEPPGHDRPYFELAGTFVSSIFSHAPPHVSSQSRPIRDPASVRSSRRKKNKQEGTQMVPQLTRPLKLFGITEADAKANSGASASRGSIDHALSGAAKTNASSDSQEDKHVSGQKGTETLANGSHAHTAMELQAPIETSEFHY